MCGKAVPKSDNTYLTTISLRQHFIQLKKFLSIKEQPKIETEIETLKNAINKLQEDLTVQKTITNTVSEQNLKLKSQIEALTKDQSALDKKVDDMTTLFRTTFEDLMKASAETIVTQTKRAEIEKREKA